MNEKKQYLDENGILFYTQKLKVVLDDLLAAKADKTEITEIEGIIDTLEATLATKVDKVAGKGLSTNDLTDELVEAIEEAGKRATLDGIALEGALTKEGLGIASLIDLSSETSARTAADAALQAAVDAINNNKVISISATDGVVPVAEVAKIVSGSVLLITNTSENVVEKFVGVVYDNGSETHVVSVRDGEIATSDSVVTGTALNLFANTYLLPDDTTYNALTAMLQEYESGGIALSSNLQKVASDLADLDADVYRKSQVYTKTETDSAISTAIGGITQIRYEIVQSLPATGENGVIYLVQYAQTPEGNVYQEWIWLANSQKYETLGSTNQIDLTNYVTFDDLEAITNSEITDIYNRVFNNSQSGDNSQSGNNEPGGEQNGE